MLTYLDTKQSSIVDVAGVCADSYRFSTLINEATRKLMRRGDWVGTVAPIHICVRRGCLVMPRYVGSVRKINRCDQPLTTGNLWYNFLNNRDWRSGRWGDYRGGCDGPGSLVSQGQSPCYSDIYGDGRYVRAYPRTKEDIGKTVTIFGVDNNNQPLRTDNGDGTWSDGVIITIGSSGMNPNYGSTSVYVRRIDRVVKDVTQGQVLLYAYDATNNVLEDLAIFDPGETSPSYARYQVNINHPLIGTASGCCGGLHTVVALVKLQFIPAKYDTDLVLIDNLDALKYAVQSIRAQEAGDLRLAKGYEAAAVQELNRELEDAYPDDTFSATNSVFGGLTFGQKCF